MTTTDTPRGREAFNARPRPKSIPRTRPAHKHEKRNRWTQQDWIAKATDAIARHAPRHLTDLLAALQIPYSTSRQWAVGGKATTIKGAPRNAVKAKAGWLEATANVPRPKRHELESLRYLTHATLDAITARRSQLQASGLNEVAALRAAVDDVIGAARKEGEERRAARRREKFGSTDPVPEKRLSVEDRAKKVAEVKEARREYLAKHPGVRRARRGNRTAAAWRKVKARRKALGGGTLRGYGAYLVDKRRRERWQKFAAELYGVSDWRYVPKKPL